MGEKQRQFEGEEVGGKKYAHGKVGLRLCKGWVSTGKGTRTSSGWDQMHSRMPYTEVPKVWEHRNGSG